MGSVRLPGKNIRLFVGRPILAYSIATAKSCGLFDDVIVSTDSDEIEEVAVRYGANIFRRPVDDGLRGTQAITTDVIKSLPRCKFACCLYATAPLVEATYLKLAFKRLTTQPPPTFVFAVGTEPLRDAGAFYFGRAEAFRQGLPLVSMMSALFPLPDDHVCDINTLEDFEECERKYRMLYR